MSDFADPLIEEGYTRNRCREHCPYRPEEHAHLRTPGGTDHDDFIAWPDGRHLGFDLTQPARHVYPLYGKRKR